MWPRQGGLLLATPRAMRTSNPVLTTAGASVSILPVRNTRPERSTGTALLFQKTTCHRRCCTSSGPMPHSLVPVACSQFAVSKAFPNFPPPPSFYKLQITYMHTICKLNQAPNPNPPDNTTLEHLYLPQPPLPLSYRSQRRNAASAKVRVRCPRSGD